MKIHCRGSVEVPIKRDRQVSNKSLQNEQLKCHECNGGPFTYYHLKKHIEEIHKRQNFRICLICGYFCHYQDWVHTNIQEKSWVISFGLKRTIQSYISKEIKFSELVYFRPERDINRQNFYFHIQLIVELAALLSICLPRIFATQTGQVGFPDQNFLQLIFICTRPMSTTWQPIM